MFSILTLVGFLAVCCLKVVNGAEVSVSSDAPAVVVDQYFKYDDITPGCNITWWTQTRNSAATFNFTGTGVSIIGGRNVRGGVYDVLIDNRRAGSIDRYADNVNRTCGVIMFQTNNLTYTPHSLALVLRANSTRAPTDRLGVLEFSEIRYTIPDDILSSMTGNPFTASSITTSVLSTSTIPLTTPITSRTPAPTLRSNSASKIGIRLGDGSLLSLFTPFLIWAFVA